MKSSGPIGVQWHVLLGTASDDDYEKLGGSQLILGLLLTWLVEIGRHWDNARASALQQSGLGSVRTRPPLTARDAGRTFMSYVKQQPSAERERSCHVADSLGGNIRRLSVKITLLALLFASPVLAHNPYKTSVGTIRTASGDTLDLFLAFTDGIVFADSVAFGVRSRDGKVQLTGFGRDVSLLRVGNNRVLAVSFGSDGRCPLVGTHCGVKYWITDPEGLHALAEAPFPFAPYLASLIDKWHGYLFASLFFFLPVGATMLLAHRRAALVAVWLLVIFFYFPLYFFILLLQTHLMGSISLIMSAAFTAMLVRILQVPRTEA